MNAKNTVMWSWTALTKYHLQAYKHSITRHTETATLSQALGTTEKIEKGEIDPDQSLDIADIEALALMTCTEATQDHNKGMGADIKEAAQGDSIQHAKTTTTEPPMTDHTGHNHICPTHCQNIFHTTEDHAVQDHTPTRGPKNHTLIGIGRSI